MKNLLKVEDIEKEYLKTIDHIEFYVVMELPQVLPIAYKNLLDHAEELLELKEIILSIKNDDGTRYGIEEVFSNL